MAKRCFNCELNLEEEGVNFCPKCGQKVDSNNLRIGAVLKEFFENYISLDTQFGRSILPFLFRPGYLTVRFNEGRRKNFANPFRLYILISIFFFFVITKLVIKDQENSPLNITNNVELREFKELPESERLKLSEKLSFLVITELNDSIYLDSSFLAVFNQMSDFRKKSITKVLSDSVQLSMNIPPDSTYNRARATINLGGGTKEGFGLRVPDINTKVIEKYINNSSYTDRQILDSLDLGEVDYRTEFVYLQIIRASRAGTVSVNRFIVKNISFAMFIIIPFAALFLFLFYYKRNKFYVEHLIHSIHLHSFVFLVYGLLLLFQSTINSLAEYKSILLWISFIVSFVYIFRSLLTVYKEKILKTVLKFIFSSILYWLFFFVVLIAEAIISFLIF